MKRLVVVLPVLVVAALAGAGHGAAAPEGQGCAGTMTSPQVIDQSGTPMVKVSVSPGACQRAEPMLQVACLQLVGSTTAPLCVQEAGVQAAQVNLSPYIPGASYVASGRTCANAGSPPITYCSTVGPTTVTL
jgi:hypothetical protein